MADNLDVMQTRSGAHPTFVLVVPTSSMTYYQSAIDIVTRDSITYDEWMQKQQSSNGFPMESSLGIVYLPIERRFNSVAYHWKWLNYRYPIYAEIIHYRLRLPTIESVNGWYDFLSDIAWHHSKAYARSRRMNAPVAWEEAINQAMATWCRWWDRYGKKMEIDSIDYMNSTFDFAIECTIDIVQDTLDDIESEEADSDTQDD